MIDVVLYWQCKRDGQCCRRKEVWSAVDVQVDVGGK